MAVDKHFIKEKLHEGIFGIELSSSEQQMADV